MHRDAQGLHLGSRGRGVRLPQQLAVPSGPAAQQGAHVSQLRRNALAASMASTAPTASSAASAARCAYTRAARVRRTCCDFMSQGCARVLRT